MPMNLKPPPLQLPEYWIEISGRIADYGVYHPGELHQAVVTARSIRLRTASVALLLDGLCRRTCPHCPDPCCLSAKVWFDMTDLLTIYLNGMPMPEAQPISQWTAVCRYAGCHGCRLERRDRPWICTWYLCPAQTALLRRSEGPAREDWAAAVTEIKTLRAELKRWFTPIVF
ncbi:MULTISPECIES: hypothetical protein [Desulfococcus]|jgi:hypothetical protein|uniref:Uncharacterized protein n=1 Tax=Desulfococcus multivorans DSM 2059 TaxID=1121405 RepID=S7TPS2_DESML|nr:hypothetical protein [Desulfococcus multivorans]AQV00242.1 hypothetical protein B2D07_05290 [Desulfococcus multivorans]EPR38946.1 hypothetical protein dsmv_0356 [Desulfococcus multivorans DSM 2059]MDX9817570.1 hypothetical protein [Desulfococcus multivorans]SJZ66703.1 hypothetical protein SAMN02745446_01294 [Desulfococcus multivorans DSM 2059]